MAGKVVKRFRSNGETVILRYTTTADFSDLLKNINSLVDERAFIAMDKKQTRAAEKKWLVALLKDVKKRKKVALVAVISGKVVGLAQIEKDSKAAFSHIGGLGISLIKTARGRGIGEKLLRAVIAEAKRVLRIKIVKLSVVAVNRPAIRCYRGCGFQKTETMRGGIKHYGKYFDRIRMIKYI